MRYVPVIDLYQKIEIELLFKMCLICGKILSQVVCKHHL